MEKTIVISGEENVQAVASLTRLYFWRTTADARQYGFKPRRGWTIRAFNTQYGTKARNWAEVLNLANGMIQARRVQP